MVVFKALHEHEHDGLLPQTCQATDAILTAPFWRWIAVCMIVQMTLRPCHMHLLRALEKSRTERLPVSVNSSSRSRPSGACNEGDTKA